MMNGSYGVVPINQNRYLGFSPDLKMGVNIKEQKKAAELPLSRVGTPVATATPAPAIPLHEQCSDKLEPLPYFYKSAWTPVLARYCDRADFESIHNLCIGEAPSARGCKKSSERLRQQPEKEFGLVADSSLVEPIKQMGVSKKSVMDWSRRNKIRQVYNALRKLCKLPDKLPDKSTDEDICKRVCYLITSNKVGMLPDGEIFFISNPVMSEADQNDSLLNAGCIRQDDVSVSSVEDVANNEKDKEESMGVSVRLTAQRLRRKRTQEKKRRDSIKEYLEIIKGNIPWLDNYNKTENFWVLYNACLYMKMVESKVGVKDCRSQPRATKSRHAKMTASTSQAKDLGKPAQSQTKVTDVSSAQASESQVKPVAIRRDDAACETDRGQKQLSGGKNVTTQDTVSAIVTPALCSVSENFPVLDFDSILDIEVSDCLAPFSANGHEAEPQEVGPHGALSTPAFRCETPVRAASPKLTDMSATVLHHINKSAKELPLEEPAQVAYFYDKTKAKYSCRLCSQTFIFKKALLKHHAADHQPESVNRLKCSRKRRAEIPATEMKDGKRIEIDDFNNNVVQINANDTSLFDSSGISGKVSNTLLVEPLSYGDPEDDHSHGAKMNSISPAIQVDEKRHQDGEGYTPDIELTDSALPSTSYCLEM